MKKLFLNVVLVFSLFLLTLFQACIGHVRVPLVPAPPVPTPTATTTPVCVLGNSIPTTVYNFGMTYKAGLPVTLIHNLSEWNSFWTVSGLTPIPGAPTSFVGQIVLLHPFADCGVPIQLDQVCNAGSALVVNETIARDTPADPITVCTVSSGITVCTIQAPVMHPCDPIQSVNAYVLAATGLPVELVITSEIIPAGPSATPTVIPTPVAFIVP